MKCFCCWFNTWRIWTVEIEQDWTTITLCDSCRKLVHKTFKRWYKMFDAIIYQYQRRVQIVNQKNNKT